MFDVITNWQVQLEDTSNNPRIYLSMACKPTRGWCDGCNGCGNDSIGIECCHLLHLYGGNCCHRRQVRWLGNQGLLLDKLWTRKEAETGRRWRGRREEGERGEKKWGWEKTKTQLNGYGKKRESGRKRGKKNERKGQGEGVMEEQMNRDLITRPLCPESVG